MHRLTVALLAAVDAAIAVAVGLAASLAPLTLLWVFGFGDAAAWGALWPASAVVWQFGNLVPLAVTLPGDYLAVTGIDQDAASFILSLAPLAFAAFTAIFAARSGVRASQADAWITGVLAGSAVYAALAAVVALASGNDVADVVMWQAVLIPSLVFAFPSIAAALVTEWREAGSGIVARLRDRVEAAPHGWGAVPGLVARGSAVAAVGLVGLGALITTVALALSGGEVIALYEAAHLDVLGATVVTLAQLAYLPTIVVWGLAFVAGPGFAVGAGTSVSPAGTQVGVVPGIPILGILPESTTPWLLLLALGPVALGALAGWIARSRLVATGEPRAVAPGGARAGWSPAAHDTAPVTTALATDAATDPARAAALAGLIAETAASRESAPEASAASESIPESAPMPEPEDPIGARLAIAVGIAVLAAAAAGVLAAVASGSIGPGSLSIMGPEPGPVALAVGLEVMLGAGILLLAPRARHRERGSAADAGAAGEGAPVTAAEPGPVEGEPAPLHLASPPEAAAPDDPPPPDAQAPDPAARPGTTPPPRPREPFSFPALPRVPPPPPDPGEGGGGAPVD